MQSLNHTKHNDLMRTQHFHVSSNEDFIVQRCAGLIQISKPSPKLFMRLRQPHQALQNDPLPCFAYGSVVAHLSSFREFFLENISNNEPIFVWLNHSNSHTKINPSYLISRGFSALHLLFLETANVSRSLPALMQENRQIAAIILDGFTPDRVVLQLARQWLHTPLEHAWVKADTLAHLRNNRPNRLFLIHSPYKRVYA